MGPVFVNVPLELLLEQVAIERLPHPSDIAASPQPDMAALEWVASLLMQVRHPLVFTEAAGKEPQAVDHPVGIRPALQPSIKAVREGRPALVDGSLAW